MQQMKQCKSYLIMAQIRNLNHVGYVAVEPGLYRYIYTHTHTHPFNGSLSGTTRVGRYQKGNIKLDFTEARDSE